MQNEFPRGSTDALEFKCTGPKGRGSACAWRLLVRILIYQKCAILSSLHAFLVPRVLSFFLITCSSLQSKPKGFEDGNAVCQVFERESGRIGSAKAKGWVICPSYTSSPERLSQALLYKCVEVLSFPRDMIENIWSDACVGEKKKGLSRKSRCSLWPVIIFFCVGVFSRQGNGGLPYVPSPLTVWFPPGSILTGDLKINKVLSLFHSC